MDWNWLARDQGPELASSRSGNRNGPASNQGTASASMRPGTGTGHHRVGIQGGRLAIGEQPQLVRDHGQEPAISGSGNRDGSLRAGNSTSQLSTRERNVARS